MDKMLIVDDSETARMFIRLCLEIAGCRGWGVVEAEDGADALRVIAENDVRFVVTDLNMPGIDGVELLQRLRADIRWQQLPVFVITSVQHPAMEKKLQDLHVTAVLPKPVSPATMTDALKRIGILQGGGA